jgi:hypothetical protein
MLIALCSDYKGVKVTKKSVYSVVKSGLTDLFNIVHPMTLFNADGVLFG